MQQNGYQATSNYKLIYVMRIEDNAHKGALKIGETTVPNADLNDIIKPNSSLLMKAANRRIKQYTSTAGIHFELLYTECALCTPGNIRTINDKAVHQILQRSGINKKKFGKEISADEWFITDLETVQKAIKAAKEGKSALNNAELKSVKHDPIIFRQEQKDAIDKAVKQFKKSNRMLWNAKMRFGKTLCALQVVKKMQFKRTLILTHRPVVNEGWFEDFNKIFNDSSTEAKPFMNYGSKDKGYSFEFLEKNVKRDDYAKYVYFASLQDLRGSEKVGGKFDKNNNIFKTPWDFIIIDEAHEGTRTTLAQNVLKELVQKNTKCLHLSGTPFNLIDDFEEDEIFTWDYTMEQSAKAKWGENNLGTNPYACLPRMNIYTFNLGKLVQNFSDVDLAFNFREFFRIKEGSETFVHEKEVDSFLNLICRKDENTHYPFSTEKYRKNFAHSLWMVPGVKEARALSEKLKRHKLFSHYEIVNVAGEGDDEDFNDDALKRVQKAVKEDYSITLSCGRLTTGVSIPEWTTVLMLAGSSNTSAASYMQTIFRVQTPAVINGKQKEECFVFDFAPDRTLKVVAEAAKVSSKAGKSKESDKKILGDFLNFCPIISIDGTKMKPYSAERLMEGLKRVYIERVVNSGFESARLYNDELLKLDNIALKEFEKLKRIIGATKAQQKMNELDVNVSGLTDEEYEVVDSIKKKKDPLTDEEKALLEKNKETRKQRANAESILRGISIRMPLLIYGADLKNEEEITLDNFAQLVDEKSWVEFMPRGVTKETFEKFKKYYDKDIFNGSGKRIRALAKAADSLTLEDRIERITAIFATFRNPDKETVLTPWRVVNMHLGDTLGGYVFYKSEGFDKAETSMPLKPPRYVEHKNVTENVFNSNTKILEINSKSGLYPLYIAYSIYKARLAKEYGKRTTITLDMQQQLWARVLKENLYVLCKTPMAKSITKRTLAGFKNFAINAETEETLIETITHNKERFIQKISDSKYWHQKGGPMKFNAIVGNPPYQKMDGGGYGQ